MDRDKPQLLNEIFTRTAKIRGLPIQELTKVTGSKHYPETAAEQYVYLLLNLMLQLDWLDPAKDPLLDEIEGALSYLDAGNIGDQLGWERLFGLIDELSLGEKRP